MSGVRSPYPAPNLYLIYPGFVTQITEKITLFKYIKFIMEFKNYLSEYGETPHYYGDTVRVLFIAAGLVTLISLPYFKEVIPAPPFLAVLAILSLDLLAGITNPKSVLVAALDMATSLLGFVVTEYLALSYFESNLMFSVINQILAVIFSLRFTFLQKQSGRIW